LVSIGVCRLEIEFLCGFFGRRKDWVDELLVFEW